jgi:hypothetical protein
MSAGLAQSVQARLVRHAKQLHLDPNVVLARYATERLLLRLSRSPQADQFVLKGALLLLAWLGETIRPTLDADFLGFGDVWVDGGVGVPPASRLRRSWHHATQGAVPLELR